MRLITLFIAVAVSGAAPTVWGKDVESRSPGSWRVDTPIVTYFAGPAMSEAVARQMAEGGFNVVWCGEKDLELLHRHGLCGMLHDPLISPDSLKARAKLDALIERVRSHPAMYSYYVIDEPAASAFPALGKLVAHLRQRDPRHMAYINLFPTYATNEQLGTRGDTIAAYREYLRSFIDTVKPDLLSYDHYQFMKGGDTQQYFLNLSLVREESLRLGVPFLNIVQAASWQPGVRVPTRDEMRYLIYTTAAYGASGISYYVYTSPGHEGGIAAADGSPTALYHALKVLNPQFVAVTKELQPLRSLAIYHTSMKEPGCEPLPVNAPFHPDPLPPRDEKRGLMLGYFGKDQKPTHVLLVNLDYRREVEPTLVGPGTLEVFDAPTAKWSPAGGKQAHLRLDPGGGKLIRLATIH